MPSTIPTVARAPLTLLLVSALLTSGQALAAPDRSLATLDHERSVKRHVIVVGVNQSPDRSLQPLEYADDDAARYAEVLAPSAASVTLLALLDVSSQQRYPEQAARAREPSRAELSRALEETFTAIAKDQRDGHEADLLFVYVGHGAVDRDGEGYVTLRGGRLTRSALFDEVVAPSPARFNHLVIDACSAYYLLHRGATEIAAVRRLLERQTLAAHPNTGAIVATSGERLTHEWSRIQGGVFSHEILSALSGAADVDRNGRVDYPEVGAFVEAANQGVEDQRARIDLFLQPPLLQVGRPLWRSSVPTRPVLVLAAAETGRFAISDGRGAHLVELHKNGEQSLAIALPGPSPYSVIVGKRELTASAAPGQRLTLGRMKPAVEATRARSALSSALERGLFAVPFGRSYVAGYRSRLLRDLERASTAVSAPPASTAPGRSDLTPAAVAVGGGNRAGAVEPSQEGAGLMRSSEATVVDGSPADARFWWGVGTLGAAGVAGLAAIGGLAFGLNEMDTLARGQRSMTALEAEERVARGNAAFVASGILGGTFVAAAVVGTILLASSGE